MPNAPTPTLNDVAEAAGVSTATVSRCLNAPDKVVEATRIKVLDAVDRLGYSPNFGARAMVAKRTNTIGAIIPTMENAMFARGLQAFQEKLHAHGYTLLVASSSYQSEIEAAQIRSLVARGAEGLLLIGQDRPPEILKFLRTQRIPALATWVFAPGGDLPSVGFDNRAAMAEMTAEVLRLGHRNLGVISAFTNGNDRSSARVEGIRQAVQDANLPDTVLTIVETAYGVETGQAAMAELLSGDIRPTAVLCGNDVLAAGAMIEARARDLRVPDDISITGFDDLEMAQVVDPQLTTVHVPHREMGTTAAAALIEMVEAGGQSIAGSSQNLGTRIIHRGSLTTPPRT